MRNGMRRPRICIFKPQSGHSRCNSPRSKRWESIESRQIHSQRNHKNRGKSWGTPAHSILASKLKRKPRLDQGSQCGIHEIERRMQKRCWPTRHSRNSQQKPRKSTEKRENPTVFIAAHQRHLLKRSQQRIGARLPVWGPVESGMPKINRNRRINMKYDSKTAKNPGETLES